MDDNLQPIEHTDATSWVHIDCYPEAQTCMQVNIRGRKDAFYIMETFAKLLLDDSQLLAMLFDIISRLTTDKEYRKFFNESGTEFDPRVFTDLLKKK